ncbi:MAG: hypothetical protein RR052_02025, partial [Oscillospiraceae bacterium]
MKKTFSIFLSILMITSLLVGCNGGGGGFLSSKRSEVKSDEIQFATPADVVLSRYFREHHKLGMRERGAIAESVYSILRNRLIYNNFAESGIGSQMRRLVLLGLADIYGTETLAGLSEDEVAWLDRILQIDRIQLPQRIQSNLPDWLYDKLVLQYGEDETIK